MILSAAGVSSLFLPLAAGSAPKYYRAQFLRANTNRVFSSQRSLEGCREVGPVGIEPTTHGLKERLSTTVTVGNLFNFRQLLGMWLSTFVRNCLCLPAVSGILRGCWLSFAIGGRQGIRDFGFSKSREVFSDRKPIHIPNGQVHPSY
jgi:hypothetical protein